jgi:4'-phosphopantetheinyl transferase
MHPRGEIESELQGISPPALFEWSPGVAVSQLAPDEARVWMIDLDGRLDPGEDADAVEPGPERAVLSADEQVRAARFLRARDRRRFVRCRAALREILGELLGEPPSSLRFRATGRGKPELDHPPAGREQRADRTALRFNVAHSAELALIAVCRGRELGVDVERVRPIAEADRIVASFFTTAEQAEFTTIADQAKNLAFHRGWTRKEAVLKALGMGLSGLAARYETRFGMTELTPRFALADPLPQVDRWMLWEAAPRAHFVAALAIDATPPRLEPNASLPAPVDTP